VRVALIEIGTAVDADVLARYEECIGIRRVPFFAHQVPPGRGCCDAGVGYDLNTGLGQLDFTQLALALGFDLAPVVAPTFTG
jgi:hypothetical protein